MPAASIALRVKLKPDQAWSHGLPRRSLGAMVKTVSAAAVALTASRVLSVEGRPRWPETWKVTVSFLSASSVRRTRAEQVVAPPEAKSRSVSAGVKRNSSVCCSILASVPFWPSGTDMKPAQAAPTSTA